MKSSRQAPLSALLAPAASAAEDEVVGAELGDAMGAALAGVAPELRQVLQAMVLDGLTVRETAVLLGYRRARFRPGDRDRRLR